LGVDTAAELTRIVGHKNASRSPNNPAAIDPQNSRGVTN
jgi:hypothetical protein